MAVSLIIDVLSHIESDKIRTNMETGGIHRMVLILAIMIF